MDKSGKIQSLLISHLIENGHIELTLPDGMVVEFGIVQENKQGQLEKSDNYCWVIASQRDRTISMDSYNFGIRYGGDKILVENSIQDNNGRPVHVLEAC